MTQLVWSVVLVLVIAGGCLATQDKAQRNDSTGYSDLPPFFPVQNQPSTFRMTALVEGVLVLDDNVCLRVKNGSGSYLPIWPYGFALKSRDGKLLVLDSTGKVVARVGESVKLGGGECPEPCRNIAEYTDQLPDERCPGPYWIVGEVLTGGG